MPRPTAAKKPVQRMRDITACLEYARAAARHAQTISSHAFDGEYSPAVNQMLIDVLERLTIKLLLLDARGGKREKGQGPALTPVGSTSAAKSAKKAGARRR
jgi:hypothetical protein